MNVEISRRGRAKEVRKKKPKQKIDRKQTRAKQSSYEDEERKRVKVYG
jgi:hypothetical protein